MRRVYTLLISGAMMLGAMQMALAADPHSYGTEFFYTCLPSAHRATDSVSFVFHSPYQVHGTLSYTTAGGQSNTLYFNVSDARRSTTVTVPMPEIVLHGMSADSGSTLGDQSEKVQSNQLIRIEGDSAFSATVLVWGESESYATALIPSTECGRSYVISSAKSTVVSSAPPAIDSVASAPGQFVIIATTDGTTVTIDYRGQTSHAQQGVRTIHLNARQWYFVQSALDSSALRSDLSATQIIADKRVVVFSGHQAASIPPSSSYLPAQARSTALMQQLVSVDRWSRDHVLVPVQISESGLSAGSNLVRIYAVTDGTELEMDGTPMATMNNGDMLEIALHEAHVLHADHAVGVMQYATNDKASNQQLGDAWMTRVHPTDQWTAHHTICALQQRLAASKEFATQYILVVTQTPAIGTVMYDGEPAASNVTLIGDGSYSFLTRKVSDGIHSIDCDSACAVYVFGYGSEKGYMSSADAEYPVHAYLKPFMHIPDISAHIGDTVSLRVYLDSLQLPPAILGVVPGSYSFDLCFNSTLITPLHIEQRGTIVNGEQVIHYGDSSITSSSILPITTIDMICGLGDAEECKMQLKNIRWYDVHGDSIQTNDAPIEGTLHITNVWHDHDGARLVNPQIGDLKVDVAPNPLQGRAFITCTSSIVPITPPSLVLYNAMGDPVADFSDEIVEFKSFNQFMYDSSALAPGVYYLRLSVDDKSAVIMVVVV